MVVECDVVGARNFKAFEKDVDPEGSVEIIVFEEVEDRFGMEREGGDVVEKAEESAGFSTFVANDCRLFEKMAFARSIEEVGDVGSAEIDRIQEVLMAEFAGKVGESLLVGADR